jgi:hypothetical protein
VYQDLYPDSQDLILKDSRRRHFPNQFGLGISDFEAIVAYCAPSALKQVEAQSIKIQTKNRKVEGALASQPLFELSCLCYLRKYTWYR